jgi:hypothetical protein
MTTLFHWLHQMTVLFLLTHQMNQSLLWSRPVTSRMTLMDHKSHRKSANIHMVIIVTKVPRPFLQTRKRVFPLLRMMTQSHLVPPMIGL